MNTEWIDIMKQTSRLKLSRWRLFDHYFVVIFILVIPLLTLFHLFEIYVTNSYDGVRTASELISTSWPWVIIAIALYFTRKRQLRFKEVKIEFTDQEFKEAVERTTNEYHWRIDLNNENILRAYRHWNWTGSWGEMITIIKDHDRLLLNSICDPEKTSSVVSFGWNKRNVETFLKHLNDAKNGIPVQEVIEMQENECTLKKVLFRLFAYPLCLFLIGFGFYMIYDADDWGTPFTGMGAIAIASFYLYTDLKLIMRTRRTNTQQQI